MCFTNDRDCEWYAETVEEDDLVAEASTWCDECYAHIAVGETYHRIFMEEGDDERLDEFLDDDLDEIFGPWPDGEGPEERRSQTYERCANCSKLLKAIEAHEIAEGCPAHARQPDLYALRDEMIEGDSEPYLERALAMFPDLDRVWLEKRMTRTKR